VVALGVAGCGGSAQATATPPTSATTPTSAPEATSPPAGEVTEAPANQPGTGPNSASVTIGGETYSFDSIVCSIEAPQYVQALSIAGDPQVSIVLPPDGWEDAGNAYSPPSVQVQIGEEFNPGAATWLAGDNGSVPSAINISSNDSRIVSYEVSDTSSRPITSTGTASFVDVAAVMNGGVSSPVAGTFTVTCFDAS
jgi:hypothetical protein